MKHDVKKNILKGAEKIVNAEVKKNNDTTAWCFGFSTSRKDLRRCSRSEIVLLGGVFMKRVV